MIKKQAPKLLRSAIALAALISISSQLYGQATTDNSTWIGIRGGANFTRMPLDPSPSRDANYLWGVAGGGGVESSFKVQEQFRLSVQLLLSQRNPTTSGPVDFNGEYSQYEYRSRVRLSYIDLPLLATWDPSRGVLQPSVFVGPQFSYLLKGQHEVSYNGLFGTDSVITDDLHRIEISGVVGIGLLYNMSEHLALGLDGAFSYGFTDVNKSYVFQHNSYIGKNREVRTMLSLLYKLD